MRPLGGLNQVTATSRPPSVPFLKPTGADSPSATSRCVCDAVVRAPIAYREIRSARYCGQIGSNASVPAVSPGLSLRECPRNVPVTGIRW